MEEMDTLNQTLIRGIPLLQRVLGGRSHFSASLTLTVFVKNVSLMSSYLDSSLDGGGVHNLDHASGGG